ncbi:MAG TPA: hypothetical protein VFS43_11320 [Polyangiaceae bacterium]|nr:hypothetical protein [Polyangiaceae bacterium]
MGLALACAALACGSGKPDPPAGAQPSAGGAPLEPPPSAPSAPPAAPPSPSAAPAEPVVAGVPLWKDIESQQKACALRARELEPNLFSGAIAVAAHRRELAMAWLLSTPVRGEGLVAFGSYDTMTRTVTRSHGLGKAVAAAPRLFRGHDWWTVAWFDRGGLVYARATHARQAYEPTHVSAVAAADAEHTAIIRTSSGPLLAVAPVRPNDRAELGLFFLDSPDPSEPPARALGATKNANGPRHPALLEAGGGFLVAWEDTPPGGAPSLLVSHFDPKGSEDGQRQRLPSPSAREPSRPALALAGPNVLAAWVETFRDVPTVFVRALDPAGAPLGPPYRVAEGTLPTLHPIEGGAALAFVSSAGVEADNVFVVGVTPSGRPAPEGYVVSEAKKNRALSHAQPALALGSDGRLAVVFSYSPEMRFAMKTLAAPCLLASAGAAGLPRP